MIRRSLVLALVVGALALAPIAPALAQSPSAASSPVPAASLLPEESPIALPEPSGAPDLEALLPKEIDGVPLEIQSFNGADLMAAFTPEDPGTTELLGILGAQGKTIADMAVANGSVETEQGYASIIAIRVTGADASALVEGFAPLVIGYEVKQTPMQLGGKNVTKLEPTQEGPSTEAVYGYANGEILWFVVSQEPLLTEVFTKLP
jgi:hypothetical protein